MFGCSESDVSPAIGIRFPVSLFWVELDVRPTIDIPFLVCFDISASPFSVLFGVR